MTGGWTCMEKLNN